MERAGRAVAVGSFVTGLMVWRDLDFVVDASGLTTGAAFEVMNRCSLARRVLNLEQLDVYLRERGLPTRG